MELEQAVGVIVKELKKDKAPGSYYDSWKSNIACFFMDKMKIEPEMANQLAEEQLDKIINSK